jgi:hypothetical protein
MRRAALNPFFSEAKVRLLEPRITKKIDILCSRLAEYMRSKRVIHCHTAFTAFTIDIITEYCFGKDGCTNYLLIDDFKAKWTQCMDDIISGVALRRAIPGLFTIIQKMPILWVTQLMPSMEVLIKWQIELKAQVKQIVQGYEV